MYSIISYISENALSKIPQILRLTYVLRVSSPRLDFGLFPKLTTFKMVCFHMAIMASMCPMVLGLTENIQSHFQSKCLGFEPLNHIANATINAHELILAGQTILYPSNDPTCNRPNQTVSVDLCRIALNITTSSRSNVLSEIWLPSNWTGRFLATGNGGIDGCTKYEGIFFALIVVHLLKVGLTDINYGAKYGFATVGSNNGHNGTGGTSFLNNDEVLQDYVFRAWVPPPFPRQF